MSETDGISHIDRLYQRFQDIYMAKWSSQFTSDAMLANWQETWCEGLAGLNAEQVRRGLNGCSNLDWPPSLPEFLRLCVGEQQRNYEAMFREAANLAAKRLGGLEVKWPNALTYWAARNFGMRELSSAAWASSKSLWTDCVDALLEEDEIKPIPTEEVKELPAPGKSHITMDQARQKISELGANMIVKTSNSERLNEWGLRPDSWLMSVHRAPLFRSSLPHALAALRRMHWSDDKIAKFSAKVWGVGEHRHIDRV